MNTTPAAKPNRLAAEKSPYLLQHAANPVDWYPWGPAAFEKSVQEDKPIFLSIGYSTCHWCHVMERESFEDPEVARLMNDAFVSIKVDREERPDIDQVYMAVCQLMTGAGGWPLTILMTPEKKPFFAGTYLPRESRFGQTGLLELIPLVKKIWLERRAEIIASADMSANTLRKASIRAGGGALNESAFHLARQRLAQSFDKRHGGFGDSQKFPTPHILFFLLRYWKRTGDQHALAMLKRTLSAMRSGGIYDQIGFGFHRYATDREWRVPHFEKMLYDQALLIMAYTEAGQALGGSQYEQTACEICDYALRDMAAPAGGFYSAEDADSEGQEGRFYLWTAAQIHQALKPKEAELAVEIYGIKPEGNFREEATAGPAGANILHLAAPLEEIASRLKISAEELRARLETIRQKLFQVRCRRVRPGKDDKILTDWNGLMIAALAKAARAFDKPEYAVAAGRAADFILGNMRPDGFLQHRFRDNATAIMANLDDHAFLIWGLIELYETAFEVQRLQTALELNRYLLDHFWDHENGGFFFTADDAEKLPVRRKEIYDGAVPSGNSVAMLNLLRLARLSGNMDLDEKAKALGRAFAGDVNQMPTGHTMLLTALDFAMGPACEVVIAGDARKADTLAMLKTLGKNFLSNAVVLLRRSEQERPDIAGIAPFTLNQTAINNRATAYVCNNFACRAPTTDISVMLEQIGGQK